MTKDADQENVFPPFLSKKTPLLSCYCWYDNHATNSSFRTFVPAASVRAFAVFAGPIPPELTADTLMTYMV